MTSFYSPDDDAIDELSTPRTPPQQTTTQHHWSFPFGPFPEEPIPYSSPSPSPPQKNQTIATSRYPHSHQKGLRGFQNPYFNTRVLGGGIHKRGRYTSSTPLPSSLSSSLMLRLIKKLRRDVKKVKESAKSMRSAGVWKTASEVKMMRGLVRKLKRRGVEVTEELAEREREKIELQRMVFRLRQEKRELEARLRGSQGSGKAFVRRG